MDINRPPGSGSQPIKRTVGFAISEDDRAFSSGEQLQFDGIGSPSPVLILPTLSGGAGGGGGGGSLSSGGSSSGVDSRAVRPRPSPRPSVHVSKASNSVANRVLFFFRSFVSTLSSCFLWFFKCFQRKCTFKCFPSFQLMIPYDVRTSLFCPSRVPARIARRSLRSCTRCA